MEDIAFYPPPDPYLVPTDQAKEARHATFQQQTTEFAWDEIVRQKKQHCLIKIGQFNNNRNYRLLHVGRDEINKTVDALAKLGLTSEIVRDMHRTDAFGEGVVYLRVLQPKASTNNPETEL